MSDISPSTSPAQRPLYRKKRVIIPAALFGLIVVANAGGGGENETVETRSVAGASSSSPSPATSTDPAVAAAAEAAEAATRAQEEAEAKAKADAEAAAEAEAERVAAEAAAAAEAAKGTVSQQNAIESARDYLSFSSFSRKNLVEQLTSEYGSSFPPADAEFAVARLEAEGAVDWNAEAAEAAKDYLEFSSFSRQGLLDQLTSEYGSGFTPAQAEYGVSQTGL